MVIERPFNTEEHPPSELGHQLIVNAFSFLIEAPNESLKTILQNKITFLDEDDISSLYQYINTLVSNEDEVRANTLNQLNSLVDQGQALALLENNKLSAWSMLYSREELIHQLSSSYIEKLKSNVSINVNEIEQAFFVANNPRFYSLKEVIYLEIAKVCLKKPAVELERGSELDITEMLQESPAVQSFLEQESAQLTECLNQIIDLNSENLGLYRIKWLVHYIVIKNICFRFDNEQYFII